MILVTGASGLLGVNLIMTARSMNRPVGGTCHRHLLEMPDVPMYLLDLTNPVAVRKLITQLQPAAIVHCAAATDLDWCEEHVAETESMNADAPAALAEIARELRVQFIHVSTDAVFDGARGGYSESDEPTPLSVYAESKLRGERQVLNQYPSALVVRVNIYGWNAQPKQSLAEWMLDQLRTRKHLNGFIDVYFCPMLANDLAETLLAMLDRGLTGLYHVVGSERISKYEFGKRVAAKFGLNPDDVHPIRLAEARLRAVRPPDVSLNTEKVSRALGRLMPGVDEGLQRFRSLRESGYTDQLRSYLASPC
jgi:dTDP-4-dehydrorhamnose reductase